MSEFFLDAPERIAPSGLGGRTPCHACALGWLDSSLLLAAIASQTEYVYAHCRGGRVLLFRGLQTFPGLFPASFPSIESNCLF